MTDIVQIVTDLNRLGIPATANRVLTKLQLRGASGASKARLSRQLSNLVKAKALHVARRAVAGAGGKHYNCYTVLASKEHP